MGYINKKTLKIGAIDTLILFGEGRLLLEMSKEARRRKIRPIVFVAPRHLHGYPYGGSRVTFKDALLKEKIPFYVEKDINRSRKLKEVITDKTIGLGIGEVYSFSRETIALFKGRLFDFMIIDLPRYRGGAHFTWQILRNDKKGCWNIQVINEDMVPGVFDSGEIIKRMEYAIPDDAEIPDDLFEASYSAGVRLFKEFIGEVQRGRAFQLRKVDETKGSFFPRRYTPEHGFINWAWSADEIKRFISAFDEPYAGASTFLRNKRLFLKNCSIVNGEGGFHPAMAGLIYRICRGRIYVAAKDGALMINKIHDNEGKDVINDLVPGQRLFTPMKYLERALTFEAKYDSVGLKTGPNKRKSV